MAINEVSNTVLIPDLDCSPSRYVWTNFAYFWEILDYFSTDKRWAIVDVLFCFDHYFRHFPVHEPLFVYVILEAIFIGSYFRYSPRRQIFSDLFSKRFYWLLFG